MTTLIVSTVVLVATKPPGSELPVSEMRVRTEPVPLNRADVSVRTERDLRRPFYLLMGE